MVEIVLPLGGLIAFKRLMVPYLVGRTYAAEHVACSPNNQVRILTLDGIEARCTTSQVAIRGAASWQSARDAGVLFLFFATPKCAIQLPKRAVGNVPALRDWPQQRTTTSAQLAAG